MAFGASVLTDLSLKKEYQTKVQEHWFLESYCYMTIVHVHYVAKLCRVGSPVLLVA